MGAVTHQRQKGGWQREMRRKRTEGKYSATYLSLSYGVVLVGLLLLT
jgi:hypothetical protein